jgi:hypothetical protein
MCKSLRLRARGRQTKGKLLFPCIENKQVGITLQKGMGKDALQNSRTGAFQVRFAQEFNIRSANKKCS